MSLPDVQELRARDDEVMARADGLAKAGRVDEALAFYRTILVDQLNPWDTDALFRFLWLCGKHGRLADGFPIAVSAAEGYGPHHAFRRRWAWGLIAQSYPLEPTPYLRIAAMGKEAGPRSDPDGLDASDRALLQSAYVRFRELGMDAAADALKAAAEFGPDDVKRSRAERLLDAAQSARYQARDAEAEEKLREALAIAPELSREAASAHEDLRALRLDLADLARAREHSRMLASLAARRGDADAARRHEEEARTQDPADAGAWLRLGERLDREGRAQAAIAYEKALACDPSAIEAWFGLGRLAHWRGDAARERRIHDRLEALDESRARAFRAEFLEAAERRPTRRLSFPEAEVGRLAARPIGQPDAWRPIGPARGAVYVPGGKDVRLEVADTHRARDLSFLRALTPDALQELILDELELSDEALAHAAHLTGLECLSIQATAMAASGVLDEPWIGIGMKLGDDSLWRGLGITGRALYHLRGLAGLRALAASNSSVGDDGLQWLASLKALERLDLRDTPVGDAGLPQLAALERLRHLDVSRSGVTARGLATLARLPQLETLRVWGTDLREASAAILAAFPRLRALDVARTGIPPRALLGCLGLELLCVGGNPIEDDELLALAALPRLRVLGVSRTELGEAGLARFRERVGDRVEVLTNRDPAWD